MQFVELSECFIVKCSLAKTLSTDCLQLLPNASQFATAQ